MATQIDHLAFETVKTIDLDDLIYFLKSNRNQKNAGGKVISFGDFKFLLSTLGVQSVTGNLVNNTIPQYPVVNQKVSTDANNDSILGTDGLLFTPERVQSVTGNLVDNTDPLNPIIDQAVSTDAGNSAILGTDGLVYVPIPPPAGVQSVTGNLVDNTNPANPVINQSVSTDANNDAILGTDSLLFVPQRVQSVTGDSVDNTDPLNPIIKSVANLTLFPTTAASDIVGYIKMVPNVTDPSYNTIPVNVPTGAITGTGQLLASLAASPGLFIGNPGVITITTTGEIRRTSGSGVAEFYFQAYHRDSLGIETLIATSNVTPPVNTVAYTQFSADALLNNGIFNATDRLVIKYYANRVPGGSNPQYDFLFGGTNPVRTLFPIPSTIIGDLPVLIGITTVDGGTNGYVLQIQSGKVGETDLKTINGNSIFGTGDIPAGVTARHDWQAPYSYMATAPLGTLDTAPIWLISRITVYNDGTTLVQTATGAWTNRYSLIYT